MGSVAANTNTPRVRAVEVATLPAPFMDKNLLNEAWALFVVPYLPSLTLELPNCLIDNDCQCRCGKLDLLPFSASLIDSRIHLMWDQRQSRSSMPAVALAHCIIKAAE